MKALPNNWRVEDGWLLEARHVPSPNYNQRPEGASVELAVIHNISLPPRRFGGPYIEDLFTNCLDPGVDPYFETLQGLEVSAHFLIRRGGEVLQFVNANDRAWHAGVSCWRERDNCNDYSVGIELEGADDIPFESIQYAHLGALLGALLNHYPQLSSGAIVGHCDIAPGRKTDPGPAFDWPRLERMLSLSNEEINTEIPE